MTEKKNLLGNGLGMVTHNKRYIVWFWLLSIALAVIGTVGFRESAHAILDHSLYAQRLTHGFDLSVFIEMLIRPEFGPMTTSTLPAIYSAVVFFLAMALFLPGIITGYASTYRLPREDFFRACGRNLWRFIRILIISGIIMGIVFGVLFAINGAIAKKAGESTNEVLPFELRMIGLAVIFLIMTTLRIWFDLAETDAVLNDQRAVRKSIAAGFRHTFRGLGRLLGSYIVAAIAAIILLWAGLWVWRHAVSPESIGGVFAVSQFTLLLLLIPRFWQRSVAVSYWKQYMVAPVVPGQPMAQVTPAPVAPEPPPVTPTPSPAPSV
ncbi:MAG: hypothetical protein WAM79_22115 [Candidatus Sulfotelmatobacter sp.]